MKKEFTTAIAKRFSNQRQQPNYQKVSSLTLENLKEIFPKPSPGFAAKYEVISCRSLLGSNSIEYVIKQTISPDWIIITRRVRFIEV